MGEILVKLGCISWLGGGTLSRLFSVTGICFNHILHFSPGFRLVHHFRTTEESGIQDQEDC